MGIFCIAQPDYRQKVGWLVGGLQNPVTLLNYPFSVHTRAFNKFCGLAYMSVSKKGIAWLIVPFNYAND